MKLELTEESVFSAVDFIVEGCRHQADCGYLDDISYYEFRAKLQGIILLLIGHADFLVDRVVAAQNEVSSIYKQSTGLALSPAQPVEAVGQGATSCDPGSHHTDESCQHCGTGVFHQPEPLCSYCRDTGVCPYCSDNSGYFVEFCHECLDTRLCLECYLPSVAGEGGNQ